MYRAFQNAKKQCDRWGDYQMNLAPFEPGKPIYYEFTHCPTAEFAQTTRAARKSCPPCATRILLAWS